LLSELNYNIYASEIHASATLSDDIKFTSDRFAFILGNERHGVSKYILEQIESKKIAAVQIRTTNIQQSINVSCAGLLLVNKRFIDTNFHSNAIDDPCALSKC
jgi:tRNA G18 (ribose-2'-O)-methylase SpoU